MERHLDSAITAVHFVSQDFILYGQGSFLNFLDVVGQHVFRKELVLPFGRRIFGISTHPLEATDSPILFLVFGEKLVSVSYASFQGSYRELRWNSICLVRCSDWVFDVRVISLTGHTDILVLCALSHHAYETFSVDINSGNCELHARKQPISEEITWSSSIYVDELNYLATVASGCYSGDIKIYTVEHLEEAPVANKGVDMRSSRTLQLEGHRGPVFCVCWNDRGNRLASTADDRSVRIWKKSTDSWNTNRFEEEMILWDSTCRIWNLSFIGNGLIIAACEDGLCRIWNLSNAQCIVRLEDNYGMNVFCVSCSSQTTDCPEKLLIATGAADSNVQIYNLSMIWTRQADRNISFYEIPPLEFNSCVDEKDGELVGNLTERMSTINISSKREVIKSMKWIGRETLLFYTDYNRLFHVYFSEPVQKSCAHWTLMCEIQHDHLSPVPMVLIEKGVLMGTNNGKILILTWKDINRKLQTPSFNLGRRLEQNSFQATEKGAVMKIFSNFPENDDTHKNNNNSYKNETVLVSAPGGYILSWQLEWNESSDYLTRHYLEYILRHPQSDGLFTSLSISPLKDFIICGDKKGRIFVFQYIHISRQTSPNEIYPLTEIHQHGDRIQCLLFIANEMVLSGSLDGILYLNKVTLRDNLVEWKQLCRRRCFYKVSTVDQVIAIPQLEKYLLVGFHSNFLTVWDILHEKEILCIDCGGWRRAHDVCFWSQFPFQIAVGFSRRRGLCLRMEYFKDSNIIPRSVSNGFHGMRINFAILSYLSNGSLALISCGEDTNVRSSLVCLDPIGLQPLQILDNHVSGVQCCALDGMFLWTGSGKDQLIVWEQHGLKVDNQSLPAMMKEKQVLLSMKEEYFGCLNQKQRHRFINKTRAKATQRVTSLNVLNKELLLSSDELRRNVISSVIASRSDGSLCIHFLLKDSNSNHYPKIQHISYLKASSYPILCSTVVTIPEELQTKNSKMFILCCNGVGQMIICVIGQTDTVMNETESSNTLLRTNNVIETNHQGAVHDLQTVSISQDSMVMLTGGEDQLVGIHTFHLGQNVKRDGIYVSAESHFFMNRHAAAVTSVWTNGKVALSCGADQRLVVWKIDMTHVTDRVEASLQSLKTIVSDISDVSCISVAGPWVAVIGYGVEFIKIPEINSSEAAEGVV
eukprot:jgi/Galph1/4717/GphlegSOOS_G3375.1